MAARTKRTLEPLEKGARVYLRRPARSDRAELLELARTSRRLHRPWIHAPATPEDFRDWLRRTRDDRHQAFLACRVDGGEIAGVIQLSEVVRGSFQSAYTGYYASARHARRGFMREGLELVLQHAFARLRLHRLEANVQPGNEASRRLIASLGFRLEGLSPRYLKIGGRWRDHERWAILAEEWRARGARVTRARA